MIKDFNFYDEKCGTCLTIGYIAAAAVAAILAGLLGGSTFVEIVLFVIGVAALGYAANRYCMSKVTDEVAAEDFNATAKAVAAKVEDAVETVTDALPSAEEVSETVEKAAKSVRETASEVAETMREATSEAVEKVSETVESATKKPAPPSSDRSAALAAAKAAAEAEAKAKAAMAKAVADLEAKKG